MTGAEVVVFDGTVEGPDVWLESAVVTDGLDSPFEHPINAADAQTATNGWRCSGDHTRRELGVEPCLRGE